MWAGRMLKQAASALKRVCLVRLVDLVQPNKPEKPDEPDKPDSSRPSRLAILQGSVRRAACATQVSAVGLTYESSTRERHLPHRGTVLARSELSANRRVALRARGRRRAGCRRQSPNGDVGFGGVTSSTYPRRPRACPLLRRAGANEPGYDALSLGSIA